MTWGWMEKKGFKRCPKCRGVMTEIRTSHLRCGFCGVEYDFSEKGLIW